MIRIFTLFLSIFLFVVIMPSLSHAKGTVNVGDSIPTNLEFQDQTGTVWNFDDLTGKKGIILIFVRSANWCPYCQKQLIEMDESTKRFEKWGYNVVSVSYDTISEMQKFIVTQKPKMTMLSDPASQSIKAFGILNEEIAKGTKAYGIPHPGVYIVGKNKKIQAKFFEEGYKDRPAVEDIFTKIEQLNPPKIPPMTVEAMGTDPILPDEQYIETPEKLPPILDENLIETPPEEGAASETAPEVLVMPVDTPPNQLGNEKDASVDTDSNFKLEIKNDVDAISNTDISPQTQPLKKTVESVKPALVSPPKVMAKPKVVVEKDASEVEDVSMTNSQELDSEGDDYFEDELIDGNSRDARIGDPEMQFIE